MDFDRRHESEVDEPAGRSKPVPTRQIVHPAGRSKQLRPLPKLAFSHTRHKLPRDRGTAAEAGGCFGSPSLELVMSHPSMPSTNIFVRIVKSYGDEVRKWLNGIGKRYAAGIGLMAGGALLVMVAAGVGTAAAFHYIEMQHGAYTAYAIVGGSYGVLGIAGLSAGRVLLGQSASRAPSPQPQIQILKRSLAVPTAALFLPSDRREVSGPDPLTQVLATCAAVTLLGWVAVTQLQRRQGRDRK